MNVAGIQLMIAARGTVNCQNELIPEAKKDENVDNGEPKSEVTRRLPIARGSGGNVLLLGELFSVPEAAFRLGVELADGGGGEVKADENEG